MSNNLQRSSAQRRSGAYVWALIALSLFILVVPRFLDEDRSFRVIPIMLGLKSGEFARVLFYPNCQMVSFING